MERKLQEVVELNKALKDQVAQIDMSKKSLNKTVAANYSLIEEFCNKFSIGAFCKLKNISYSTFSVTKFKSQKIYNDKIKLVALLKKAIEGASYDHNSVEELLGISSYELSSILRRFSDYPKPALAVKTQDDTASDMEIFEEAAQTLATRKISLDEFVDKYAYFIYRYCKLFDEEHLCIVLGYDLTEFLKLWNGKRNNVLDSVFAVHSILRIVYGCDSQIEAKVGVLEHNDIQDVINEWRAANVSA